MPIYTNLSNGPANDLADVRPSTGQAFGAAVSEGYETSPGVVGIKAGLGAIANEGGTGGWVSQTEAASRMKQEGYDGSTIPKQGISGEALRYIMERQSVLARDRDMVSRSNLSGPTQFVAGMIGGTPDPINLVATALAPEARMGLGARLAVGGATNAAAATTGVAVQAAVGRSVGDPDVNMSDAFRSVALATVMGAGLHGAFGGRAVSTDTIAALERSDAAAKVQGVDVNHVVSPAGAVGKHQIMPETAKGLGIDPAELTKPEVNERAAGEVLDQLSRKYGNDPEAVAIAYNAGPRRADEWIKAGRDDRVLPAETRDYVGRLREQGGIEPQAARVPPEIQPDLLKTAVAQAGEDSPVRVDPVLDAFRAEDSFRTNPFRIRDEHEDEVRSLTTQGMTDALPKPGSALHAPEQEMPPAATYEPPKPAADLPQTADATKQMQDAVKEAQSHFQNTEGEIPAAFKAAIEEAHADVTETEAGSKAIEAAVRCGIHKGLT